MKTPLNVRWHYYHSFSNENKFFYKLTNGTDLLVINYYPIEVSRLEEFIKYLPLTKDFQKPIYANRIRECVRSIVVVPNESFFISIIYYTTIYQNHFTFDILKKSENVFEFKIIKKSINIDTHLQTENIDTQIISKEEATNIFSKLPETIDLGIFKLPLGNCFGCAPVED